MLELSDILVRVIVYAAAIGFFFVLPAWHVYDYLSTKREEGRDN